MPRYKVAVEWSVCTEIEVEANSVEEAIMEVEYDDSLIPADGDYIDGSLKINHDMTYYFNKNHIS